MSEASNNSNKQLSNTPMPASTQALVVAHDLAKTFDVSAPWLTRVIERRPRQLLKAVDGVSFEIERGRVAVKVRWRVCWWACTSLRVVV